MMLAPQEQSLIFDEPTASFPIPSPDGRRIAHLAQLHGVPNLWVSDVPYCSPTCVTNMSAPIRGFKWSYDSEALLFEYDEFGNETTRVYSCNLKSRSLRNLSISGASMCRLAATSPRRPQECVIQANRRAGRWDLFVVNVYTGESAIIAEDDGATAQWLVDRDFQPRVRLTYSEGGIACVQQWERTSAWSTLLEWGPEETFGGLIDFDEDGESILLLTSLGADTSRLCRLQLSDASVSVVAAEERYDMGRPLLDHNGGVIAFQVRDERISWRPADPQYSADLTALAGRESGVFHVIGTTLDNRRWTVAYEYDRKPPEYFLYDRMDESSTPLFSYHGRLRDLATLACSPIEFTARDGIKLYGYFSRSTQAEVAPRGLIVMVHGGPWTRDVWGFDPEVQFLCALGFDVLQVNYRGSSGYGKAFLALGNGEWGRKMQSDIYDAAQWALEAGLAPKERVGIYGKSYGGYAALMAAAQTDFFCCALAFAAPVDLPSFLRHSPLYGSAWQPILEARVGNPETQRAELYRRSPVALIDHIDAAVFIAHGRRDPRVPIDDTLAFFQRLRLRNPKVEMLILEEEGHTLNQRTSRLRFFETVENFLDRFMPRPLPQSAR
jgi:dipeptidyl aminopeptidase/acylaminoacyl peptidase